MEDLLNHLIDLMENDNKKTKVFMARESNDKVNENIQEYIPDKVSDALIINN